MALAPVSGYFLHIVTLSGYHEITTLKRYHTEKYKENMQIYNGPNTSSADFLPQIRERTLSI